MSMCYPSQLLAIQETGDQHNIIRVRLNKMYLTKFEHLPIISDNTRSLKRSTSVATVSIFLQRKLKFTHPYSS